MAIAQHIEEHFFSALGHAGGHAVWPPWQTLGAVHWPEHWLDLVATILREAPDAPITDPYVHREGDAED